MIWKNNMFFFMSPINLLWMVCKLAILLLRHCLYIFSKIRLPNRSKYNQCGWTCLEFHENDHTLFRILLWPLKTPCRMTTRHVFPRLTSSSQAPPPPFRCRILHSETRPYYMCFRQSVMQRLVNMLKSYIFIKPEHHCEQSNKNSS